MSQDTTRHPPLYCTACSSRVLVTIPEQNEYRLECECLEATWDGGWPDSWRPSVTTEEF